MTDTLPSVRHWKYLHYESVKEMKRIISEIQSNKKKIVTFSSDTKQGDDSVPDDAGNAFGGCKARKDKRGSRA